MTIRAVGFKILNAIISRRAAHAALRPVMHMSNLPCTDSVFRVHHERSVAAAKPMCRAIALAFAAVTGNFEPLAAPAVPCCFRPADFAPVRENPHIALGKVRTSPPSIAQKTFAHCDRRPSKYLPILQLQVESRAPPEIMRLTARLSSGARKFTRQRPMPDSIDLYRKNAGQS